MPSRSTYTISIHGLETYAYHGVPDHEQATGHRYQLDIEMEVSGSADISDDVADTVDYGEAALLALKVVNGPSVRTLERLTRLIAEAIFREFPSVVSLTVNVEKPFPPAPIVAKSMGVRLSLERGL